MSTETQPTIAVCIPCYRAACFEGEFSFARKLYNCVFYIPLFAGSLVSLVLWTRRTVLNNEQLDRLATVLIAMVLAFSVMHAMLQVDYGWRYRIPIIPCLMMLTAVSIDAVLRRWKQRTQQPVPTTPK